MQTAAFDLDSLRLRLFTARRARMARDGRLGRTIAALHCIADRLDEDNVRSSGERRLQGLGRGPVGYGWGMIDRLVVSAVSGTASAFAAEWGRLATEQGLHAAEAFGVDITHAIEDVRAVIHDATGRTSGDDAPTPAEFRALADRLAVKAMPLPGDDRTERNAT